MLIIGTKNPKEEVRAVTRHPRDIFDRHLVPRTDTHFVYPGPMPLKIDKWVAKPGNKVARAQTLSVDDVVFPTTGQRLQPQAERYNR